MELWLWAEECVPAGGLREFRVYPEDEEDVASKDDLLRLCPGEDKDSLDVSMVSLSFSPSVLRTHRSRFGSEKTAEVWEDTELSSSVRFLQTLLLTCGDAAS